MLSNLPGLSAHVLRLNFITLADAPTRSLGVCGERRQDAGEERFVSGSERKEVAVYDAGLRCEPRQLVPQTVRPLLITWFIQAKPAPALENFHFDGLWRLLEHVPFVEAAMAFVMGFIRQSMNRGQPRAVCDGTIIGIFGAAPGSSGKDLGSIVRPPSLGPLLVCQVKSIAIN